MTNVTIYYERVEELTSERVQKTYPQGMAEAIASAIRSDEVSVRCFFLSNVEEITQEVLKNTDVLIWWGHMAHKKVPDEIAQMVQQEVLKGMGAIFLHSAHHSKPFKLLMGTSCNLTWRENGDSERVWVTNPAHPIARGLGRFIKLNEVETYGEPFDIPEPDELVFIGGYSGGEVFRSGCCYRRGSGKIFYFQPGHETFPIFYNEDVRKVLRNAVQWVKPEYRVDELVCPHVGMPE